MIEFVVAVVACAHSGEYCPTIATLNFISQRALAGLLNFLLSEIPLVVAASVVNHPGKPSTWEAKGRGLLQAPG